jgi:CheY-like chemotaxis protein
MKQHQGWVEVESVVGQGTTFSVLLPRCEGEVALPEEEETRRIRGGKETILVVEDEAPVRELVCNLLAGHGYQILQAESGAKALELWNRCKDKVDLLLTDLVMPDRVSGRELAEKLWSERPKLKVIFTSGYSSDVAGKDFVLHQGFNYLQKPYHPHRLASAVRDCLDGSN